MPKLTDTQLVVLSAGVVKQPPNCPDTAHP
jgi:hypothetical protein